MVMHLLWLPIILVMLFIVPAVLGLDVKKEAPFKSFRERMKGGR